MASLCHPWVTTTNLSYRFPTCETSVTALCGTTVRHIKKSTLKEIENSPAMQIENYLSFECIYARKMKNGKNPCVSYGFFLEYVISIIKVKKRKKMMDFCDTKIYFNFTRKKKWTIMFHLQDRQLVRKNLNFRTRFFYLQDRDYR